MCVSNKITPISHHAKLRFACDQQYTHTPHRDGIDSGGDEHTALEIAHPIDALKLLYANETFLIETITNTPSGFELLVSRSTVSSVMK
jgi:hypothetical protein